MNVRLLLPGKWKIHTVPYSSTKHHGKSPISHRKKTQKDSERWREGRLAGDLRNKMVVDSPGFSFGLVHPDLELKGPAT